MSASKSDPPPQQSSSPCPVAWKKADFFADPHQILHPLQKQGRMHDDPLTGSVLMTHFDDVKAGLSEKAYSKDPRKLSPEDALRRNITRPDGSMRQPNMLFLDPPQHTRLRSLVNKAFTARSIAAREPRIRDIANELLRSVSQQKTFDVIAVLARPLPVRVIGEMLGIPIADRERFYGWSDAFAQDMDPSLSAELRMQAQRAKEDFSNYLLSAIKDRRQRPGNDLLSELLLAEEQNDRLTENELVQMCALLLVAGNMTTTDLIGNGVLALLEHPDALAELCQNPALLNGTVEEMLRYDTSVTGVGRNLIQDTELAGQHLPAFTRLHLSITGANRDPAVFANSNQFDIKRAPNPHLSFGHGIHYCLGAQLARAEIRIAIEALVQRFPQMTLAISRQALTWRTLVYFRGLDSLPIHTGEKDLGNSLST